MAKETIMRCVRCGHIAKESKMELHLKGCYMKTLDEYNEEMRKKRSEFDKIKHLSGVACNKCGTEMHYPEPGAQHLSNPPCMSVKCPKCGYSGYKTM